VKTFPVFGAALLLAACGANETADNGADDTNDAATNTMADAGGMAANDAAMPDAPTDAAGYMAMAGAGDMWEIESSKVFMAKSDNADLKKFAQMMVDHHTQSTEKVKAAAKSANLTPPTPQLDAEQQRMLDEIKAASATNVDEVYKRNQATAHQKALALHQGYAARGDNDALKRAAGEIAPVVQKHITELGRM
jgi:putative membrane protein